MRPLRLERWTDLPIPPKPSRPGKLASGTGSQIAEKFKEEFPKFLPTSRIMLVTTNIGANR